MVVRVRVSGVLEYDRVRVRVRVIGSDCEYDRVRVRVSGRANRLMKPC